MIGVASENGIEVYNIHSEDGVGSGQIETKDSVFHKNEFCFMRLKHSINTICRKILICSDPAFDLGQIMKKLHFRTDSTQGFKRNTEIGSDNG